jgi:hypothetical protein
MKANILNLTSFILMAIALYWVGVGSFTDNSFLPYSEFFFDKDSGFFMVWISPLICFLFYGMLSNALILIVATLVAKKLDIHVNYFEFGVAFGKPKVIGE